MSIVKLLALAAVSLLPSAPTGGSPTMIRIARSGTQPSQLGPAEHFTGSVRIAMTHIAVQEQLDGKVVAWMEKVPDEQYGRP